MSAPTSLRSSLATMTAVFAGMVVLTWVIGFGIYEFYAARHAAERDATYAPIDAVATAHPPEFVALRGPFHPRGYMTLGTSTSSDGSRAAYLPVLAPGADARAPVFWIVKAHERDVRRMPPMVHAHVRGESLPPIVREGFARQGIVVAPDARVVDFVETQAGKPIDQTPQEWELFLILAGGITGITVLLWITVSLRIAWESRGGRAPRKLQPGA